MSKYDFGRYVQHSSIDDFDAAKKLYESITPIRDVGARSRCAPDTRPLGRRDRPNERIVKISRDEYSATNSWYSCSRYYNHGVSAGILKKVARGVTFKRNGEVAIYPQSSENNGKDLVLRMGL